MRLRFTQVVRVSLLRGSSLDLYGVFKSVGGLKMPLNVRRFCTAVFVPLLVLVSLVFFAGAQTLPTATPVTMPQAAPPTSGDVMRERISRSKAYIAVRNYHAAIYELENIRKETADPAVHGVVNVLLMNSYLEQGDYKRAQGLLTEFYTVQKTTKPNASEAYMAVAGQIVKGARSRVERYRALGLSVSDRSLPLEASNDLEKMRETLELVITQAKEMGAHKAKTEDAMMLLEEASSSRSMLARDDYDQRRWKDEVADTREQVANSRSTVLSAVHETPADSTLVANNTQPATTPPVMVPVGDAKPAVTRDRQVAPVEKVPPDTALAQNTKPIIIGSAPPTVKEEPKPAKPETAKDGSPLDVGSLKEYATSQAKPIYPPAAKTLRTTGVVKVEFTVDEKGDVAAVEKTTGPAMLQAAAKDAIRKWKFKPFMRDGQPVRATGFVSFNFAL